MFQEITQLILMKVALFFCTLFIFFFRFFVYILDFEDAGIESGFRLLLLLYTAVDALKAVRRELKDPKNNLWNWEKTDPCEPGKQWNGVICTKKQGDGGYFHIQELYAFHLHWIFLCCSFTFYHYAFIIDGSYLCI